MHKARLLIGGLHFIEMESGTVRGLRLVLTLTVLEAREDFSHVLVGLNRGLVCW